MIFDRICLIFKVRSRVKATNFPVIHVTFTIDFIQRGNMAP